MSQEIRHDTEGTRFVSPVHRDGGEDAEAVLSYIERGDVVDFKSTLVPPEARGTGLGGRLVQHGLDWARSKEKRVIPTCPFVASWIEEHPDYQELLADRAEPVSDRGDRPIGTQVQLGDE